MSGRYNGRQIRGFRSFAFYYYQYRVPSINIVLQLSFIVYQPLVTSAAARIIRRCHKQGWDFLGARSSPIINNNNGTGSPVIQLGYALISDGGVLFETIATHENNGTRLLYWGLFRDNCFCAAEPEASYLLA